MALSLKMALQRICDRGMAKGLSANPLEIPLSPMTQLKDAHVLNSKEETKMTYIIKVNPKLEQELGHFLASSVE